jgi:hypothetical protein
MSIGLSLILVISTALLFGNEFSVGFLIHPALSRSNHLKFLPAIQVLADLFGKIMPVWMAATLIAHAALLYATWRWPAGHTILLLIAVALWTVIIVFSILGPVPINNRVKKWQIDTLPADWEQQRRRWDLLNAVRVILIGFAFIALLLAFRVLS